MSWSQAQQKYSRSDLGKQARLRYQNSPKGREAHRKYLANRKAKLNGVAPIVEITPVEISVDEVKIEKESTSKSKS